jgi:RNA polymerase sigma factor (sigma-70 family)
MDAETFTRIAKTYRRRMLGYARKRLTLADAEDAVQDALVGILDANLPDGTAATESLVFGILKRRVIDTMRRNGRRHSVNASDVVDFDGCDESPSPDEYVIHAEETAAMLAAIASDVHERETTDGRILRAVFIDGMDAGQAAEACGTVRQRVYEAKFGCIQRLRERLAVA